MRPMLRRTTKNRGDREAVSRPKDVGARGGPSRLHARKREARLRQTVALRRSPRSRSSTVTLRKSFFLVASTHSLPVNSERRLEDGQSGSSNVAYGSEAVMQRVSNLRREHRRKQSFVTVHASSAIAAFNIVLSSRGTGFVLDGMSWVMMSRQSLTRDGAATRSRACGTRQPAFRRAAEHRATGSRPTPSRARGARPPARPRGG